jgi:hypothetical protein
MAESRSPGGKKTRRITAHRSRLIRYYGRIAGALLRDPEFQKRLREIAGSLDPAISRALQAARTCGTPPDMVLSVAAASVEATRKQFRLPYDWDMFIWTAAVLEGKQSRYPICPSFTTASLMEGPEQGFFVGITANQMAWWNSGALVYALTGFKSILGSLTKPGRQPDYERSCQLAQEHQRLGTWENVYREQERLDTDATAIRRQVKRFRERGYR